MAKQQWDKNKDSYKKTPKSFLPGSIQKSRDASVVVSRENQLELTGIFWESDSVDLGRMRQGGVEWARARMQKRLPQLIWSTAALEGNTFTLPEVQTLLDGVTVDGKRLEEQQQVLALQETFNFLDGLISTNSFRLNEHTSNEFHARVARHEAIESGHFRGLGSVTGGGTVRLSTGGTVEGLPTDQIPQRFEGIVDIVKNLEDPRLGALVYFAAATRSQFYFDGNKRTARMMASGILLENGYDAINIPFERRLEYNKCLDVLFTTNNATPIMAFVASCA